MKKTIIPLLVFVLLLPACSVEQPTAATATVAANPTAPPTPEASPSATVPPEIGFPAINLLPGRQAGDWRVVGLIENGSAVDLINAHVLVTLLDASANPLSSVEVPITFTHLGSNETSPFQAEFLGAGLAMDARASLSSYETGGFQRHELQVEIVSASSVERGGTAILAAISNPGDGAASIAALGVLAQDSRGRILGLATLLASPEVVRSGETVAALALLDIGAGAQVFIPYADAVPVDLMTDPQPVSLDGSVRLVFDDQDNPIVIGALKNNSEQSHHASVLLVLSYQQAGISMAQLDTTIPLGPGEIRPFTVVEFPGQAARLQQVGGSLRDVEVLARLAPLVAGSAAEPYSPLDLTIQSFERIGGFGYVHGSVTNPYANPVEDASVMATLYGSSGRIITAGWFTVPARLSPGESYGFVLPIPIPAYTDPRLSEFDLWAAGIQSSIPADESD